MEQLVINEIDSFKEQLQELIKPYQQEQNQRQKKVEFLNKCVRCIEKNDFFQLDELLRGKQTQEVLEDPNFKACDLIFSELREFAQAQVDSYRLKVNGALLELAEEAGLPFKLDFPRFSVLKGIEGEVDFSKRTTVINQMTLKSVDPKKVIAAALRFKRKLYDTPFDPQKFINALFECHQEISKKTEGNVVPVQQLYTEYVWSLQNKTFFQNMDKGKFKGYSIEQFSVDLWRYFESDASATESGYQIKLNSGRGKSLWLIDQTGEKRQITNVSFTKI